MNAETVQIALRALIADLDYDLHKGLECGEEDGLDRYPELAAQFVATYRSVRVTRGRSHE